MERCTTFLEHFLAGHFGTVQTSSNLDLHTLSASAHSVLDSHLNGTTVSDLALYLAGDIVAHDVGVELRLLNLEDVNLDVLLVELLELFLELVNILSTLTNDDTRTCCADCDGDELESTLDNDA